MPLTKVSSGVIAANAVVDSFGTQSITGDKLGLTAINANNIVNASITGNLLTSNCVAGNNIVASVTLTTPIISGNLNLDSTGTSGIRLPAANTLAFHTAGTEDMRIDATGNVGIGTASPTAVTGFSTGRKVLQITPLGGGNTQLRLGATSGAMLDHDDSGSTITTLRSLYGTTDANAKMQFQAGFITFGTGTSFTERMRITSGGLVGIGTSSPSALLQVAGSSIFQDSMQIFNNPSSSQQGILFRNTFNVGGSIFSTGPATTNDFILWVGGSGTQGGITGNGAGVNYSSASDYRLKENVAPMTNALGVVAQLKPCTYIWKFDGSAGQGFIAHELQEVFPDAVTGKKDDVDEYGNIKPQGVDTSFLVATLAAAIQEQQAIITDLKARIEVLEAQ